MEYRKASRYVEAMVEEAVAVHHPHLYGLEIDVVFTDKTPKSKGREVWGRAKKISGLNEFLARPKARQEEYGDGQDFFVIELSEKAFGNLTTEGQKALIDHCLSQCEIVFDEETQVVALSVVGPDIAEFEGVVRRHGLWRESVKDFVQAGAEQLSLEAQPA